MQETFSWKRFAWLGIGTFLFYLWMAWALPITDTVESNYALSAVTMMQHGEFLSPMIYDVYWFDKPIMAYWGLILSYSLFGISDLAARLPSIFISTCTVLAMYRMAFSIYQVERVAMWSAIALGTALEFWYIGHAVVTDGYLFLFSLGIFYYVYRGVTGESHRHMVYAYLFAGLAVLTKGPVGIVLPGIILILYVALNRRMDWFKYVFSWKGILAFLIVVAPWYGYMYQVHGAAFVDGFLGLHNVTRAIVPEHPEHNWWYLYFALLPICMMPWTSFVLRGVNEQKHAYIWYWSIFWFVGTIVFYTCMATKYITYTFIMLIPLSLWAGMGVHACIETYKENTMTWNVFVLYALGGFPFLLGIVLALLTVPAFHTLYIWGSLLVLVICIVYAAFRRTGHVLVCSMATSAIVFYLALVPTLEPVIESQSGKQLATEVTEIEGSTPLEVYQYGNYRTSLSYYLGRTTSYIHYKEHESVWEDGKNIMPMVKPTDLEQDPEKLSRALIYVPIKYAIYFKETSLYDHLQLVKKSSNGAFFKVK
jgi:dolichyl-phosphate-mannose-protein mannosyltransferase